MSKASEDLLRPSLSPGHRKVRLYSPTAMFYTAFFGGPVAALAFSTLNSKQLDRTKEDQLWYVLAGVGTLLWIFTTIYVARFTDVIPPDFLGGVERTGRYIIRAFGLALWGGFYFMHRPFHRTNELVGAEPLNPWKPAIGCILVAMVIQGGAVAASIAALS